MFKEVQLSEIAADGFLHSRIIKFASDCNKKIIIIHFNHADLKIKGSFYSCVMSITDWWDFEVYEYNKHEIVRYFSLENIPELNQILDLSFDNDELVITGIGLSNNTAIDYKFIKPKIHIEGEFDPD